MVQRRQGLPCRFFRLGNYKLVQLGKDILSTQNLASFEGVEGGDLAGVTIFLDVPGTVSPASSLSETTIVLRRFPSRTIYNQSGVRNWELYRNLFVGFGKLSRIEFRLVRSKRLRNKERLRRVGVTGREARLRSDGGVAGAIF